MEIKKIPDNITQFIKKYRYAALILIIGLVLMAIPQKTSSKQAQEVLPITVVSEAAISDQLAEILSQISGAGKVQVMLTVAKGEETIYQTNNDCVTSNDSNNTQMDTVTVTDKDRNESGLIKQRIPASYMGAIVVCQGADNSTVRLAIVEAVANITGLGTDRISVLKMK